MNHRLGNKNNFRHGHNKTPTWNAWMAAKNRCKTERAAGRECPFFEPWTGRHGFVGFLDDMGERPSSRHTLARVDPRVGFTPSNCRWVTRAEWGAIRPTEQESSFKHGMTKTPTWNSWRAMRMRCENPVSPGYVNYGARGISVCDRWRDSFVNFLADMGERPTNHTIDRIDSSGNYSPENCRWATPAMQSRNTRAVKFEPHEPAQVRWLLSEGFSQAEIGRFFGVSRSVIEHIARNRTWREDNQ